MKKIFSQDETENLIRSAQLLAAHHMSTGKSREEAYTHVAKFVAARAHKGQTLKIGGDYLSHPLHVGDQFTDPARRQIGYLHDVLEKTNLTTAHLAAMGFSSEVVENVNVLTPHCEFYLDDIVEIGKWPLACDVKIEDLDHNMRSDRRVPGPLTESKHWHRESYGFAKPYLEAIRDEEFDAGRGVSDFVCHTDFLLKYLEGLEGPALHESVNGTIKILTSNSSERYSQLMLGNTLLRLGIFKAPVYINTLDHCAA